VIEFSNINFRTIRALDTGPLCRSYPITEYEQIDWPRLGMVDFGGFGGIRREFAARVEEVSPKTPVSIHLEDHRQTARSMLPLGAD
jgi:hypothetical protein